MSGFCRFDWWRIAFFACAVFICIDPAEGVQEKKTAEKGTQPATVVKADLYEPLTEPPCSYCVNQNLKELIRDDDVVLAWIRGKHNGGAMPLRHFIAAPRVVNDTYGLFFYDPDGGYVASFKKDYGYRFYGWRGGVMQVIGRDGTIWSALTGRAIDGPQTGARLERVPSMLTSWRHWLMLHPESTAYDLFDGKRYPLAELPTEISAEAMETIGEVDPGLEKFDRVIGIEGSRTQLAVSLEGLPARACQMVEVDDHPVAVFWYGATQSAVAFHAEIDGRKLTFYADEISPETAPFKDRETGTRWTLAGRGVDGELRGKELEWMPSIACRWYAWSGEYPETVVFGSDPDEKKPDFDNSPTKFKGVVLRASEVNPDALNQWQGHAIALYLEGGERAAAELAAANEVLAAKLKLDYFIEVGRCPELADNHPEWMASLQGHGEWRKLFPDAPEPGLRQVIKNYPWVPILYKESFEAHLHRIERLLRGLPAPGRIWLNDLQGAPSACGCGHPLCRWTADYGPIKTATPMGDDAAARFAEQVLAMSPGCEVVPILVSECELEDRDTVCCGVGCYEGSCWKAFSRQLDSLALVVPRIGVGCFYREFARDLERYGEEAGWVRWAIESFGSMPKIREGTGVLPDRLIAIIQGWDVTASQLQSQIDHAESAGAGGYLIARQRIAQTWQPKLFDLPAGFEQPKPSKVKHAH